MYIQYCMIKYPETMFGYIMTTAMEWNEMEGD